MFVRLSVAVCLFVCLATSMENQDASSQIEANLNLSARKRKMESSSPSQVVGAGAGAPASSAARPDSSADKVLSSQSHAARALQNSPVMNQSTAFTPAQASTVSRHLNFSPDGDISSATSVPVPMRSSESDQASASPRQTGSGGEEVSSAPVALPHPSGDVDDPGLATPAREGGAATDNAEGDEAAEGAATVEGDSADRVAVEEDDHAATLRLVQQLMEQEELNRLREWEEAQMQQVLAMSAANLDELEGEDADLALALRMQREEGGLSEAAASNLGGAVVEANGEEAGASEEAGGLDVDNMDYDQLLTLGQQLGDVKTERWAAVADQHIAKIPTYTFTAANGGNATGGDHMCCVCQCDFEEEEKLMSLPCEHTFHAECISKWLEEHSTCCVCKASILPPTPEKTNPTTSGSVGSSSSSSSAASSSD